MTVVADRAASDVDVVTANVLWKATAPLNVTVDADNAASAVDVVTANVDWNATAPVTVRVANVVAAFDPAMRIPPAAPGVAATTLFMFLTFISGTPAVAGVTTVVAFHAFTSAPPTCLPSGR